MSTFDGHVAEFPDIQIDCFRRHRDAQHQRPALAYFLSHVHSDHLTGLESCRSPFIYCSAATREILLRLEKYPHRINFARGILERRRQTYRHLRSLLKPIPLDTPTELQLAPGRSIRVTLLDANHCIGAVMFLIEGDGKTILYTGDIRSEVWWVDSLKRHPVMIPYVWGVGEESTEHARGSRGVKMPVPPLKRLDNIYLDTTFATKADPHRAFPSKQEGIAELLKQVSRYPPDTRFYFDTWTFGYEDVWQALAVFLHARIHVDNYRYGLYSALCRNQEPRVPEAAMLIGSTCGNHSQTGCLSTSEDSRLHSCEHGMGCSIWGQPFVRITPIVSRHRGSVIAELGTGGGHGDLDQHHDLVLDNSQIIEQLIVLCYEHLKQNPDELKRALERILAATQPTSQPTTIALRDMPSLSQANSRDAPDPLDPEATISIAQLIDTLAGQTHSSADKPSVLARASPLSSSASLPSHITFPYSRHSSYSELLLVIAAFRPREIYPCTVDKSNWSWSRSMTALFGHLYPPQSSSTTHTNLDSQKVLFSHDAHMLCLQDNLRKTIPKPPRNPAPVTHEEPVREKTPVVASSPPPRPSQRPSIKTGISKATSRRKHEYSSRSAARLALRRAAFAAALAPNGSWAEIGLVSVRGQWTEKEVEL